MSDYPEFARVEFKVESAAGWRAFREAFSANWGAHFAPGLKVVGVSCGSTPEEAPAAKPKPRKKRAPAYTEEFLRFWEVWEPKTNKANAAKAFKGALNHPEIRGDVAVLVSRLRTWQEIRQRDWGPAGPPIAPHASTWLNQERFAEGELRGLAMAREQRMGRDRHAPQRFRPPPVGPRDAQWPRPFPRDDRPGA